MTRKEAINLIADMDSDKYTAKEAVALTMAIKALEQEPCEDCISRQAVLDGLASIAKAKAKSDAQKSLMGRVMFFTEQLPSVSPQQTRWIQKEEEGEAEPFIIWECGNCHRYQRKQTEYCPNCGAKMEEEE